MPEPFNLADALGDVRQAIRALQAHEAQLRQQLLAQRGVGTEGARFFVTVEEKRQRRFVRDRLPAAILQDGRFWTLDTRTVVRALPLEERPFLQRAAGARPPTMRRAAPPMDDDDEDIVLIEDG